MPAYNSQEFIQDAINSIIEQTYCDWELLIADNNSIDNTAKIVKDNAIKDSRIKYLLANEKQGAGYARNVSIREAKGDYIAFLDSDDLWAKDKLKKQIKFMNDNDLTLSYTTYKCFGLSEEVVKKADEVNYNKLLYNNVIGCSTVMINLEKINHKKYYMNDLKVGEDWCMWCNILKDTNSTAKCLDETLTHYRIDLSSLSGNKIIAAKCHFMALYKHLKVGALKSCFYFLTYSLLNIKNLFRWLVASINIKKKV
jgi:glycosyltransferase involved in cell wall biosynthesis